jgi:hypothetical protein
MIAILLGPLAERGEDWPPAWPLDPDGEGDARQLAVLASYLRLTEADWRLIVTEAEVVSTTPTFRRLVGLIGRALELKDQLSTDDLRWLIGAKTLRQHGIPPQEQE